jgi:hypothetical protein
MFTRFKPLVINCYTTRQNVFDALPIKPAINSLPKWWRQIPNAVEVSDTQLSLSYPVSTLKNCIGINNLFSKGFIIPMWSDCVLRIGSEKTLDFSYRFADEQSVIGFHPPFMFGKSPLIKNAQHLKFHSPWYIVCDEEVQFLYLEPTWAHETQKPFQVLPAVLDYKHQHGSDVNVVATRVSEDYQISIDAGTPLVHIIPLTERKVVVKNHCVLEKDIERIMAKQRPLKFLHNYRFFKKANEQRKCPF